MSRRSPKPLPWRIWLDSLVNYERTPGYDYRLDGFRRQLTAIGSPHLRLRNVILIAGTKGKGSTAAILNSCLMAHGYTVGLYTSPHLVAINERIRLDGRPIADRELAGHIAAIRRYFSSRHRVGARTFFEALTAVAFRHFARHNTDFTILEVGLGGRRDATNSCQAMIPVMTRIGYDHMNLLGRRLADIAYEKAGIMRRPAGWPRSAITIKQRPAVMKVLAAEARQTGYRLFRAEDRHRVTRKCLTLAGGKYRIDGELGRFTARLPLAGVQHDENLALALAVLAELKKCGYPITIPQVVRGLSSVRLAGRFEVLRHRPLTIYDAAHNDDSFRALEQNLGLLKGRRLYFVFGCSNDKDIGYCLRHILPRGREAILVKADHPRAMALSKICLRLSGSRIRVIAAGSVPEALAYCEARIRSSPAKPSAIVVFGSFYLYADVKKWLTNKK